MTIELKERYPAGTFERMLAELSSMQHVTFVQPCIAFIGKNDKAYVFYPGGTRDFVLVYAKRGNYWVLEEKKEGGWVPEL